MEQTILMREFIKEYLSVCKKSKCYKKSLENAGNHLERFSKVAGLLIFTDMDEQIIEDFTYYLQDLNFMPATVKTNINRIKYLLQKARKSGYKTNAAIDDYNVADEEAVSVFLTMREVMKIHRYSNLTMREQEIKDYFILGCLTALRFSDYSRLQVKNFVRNKIVIKTKKTNTPVQIPIHPVVREIIAKYDKHLPSPPSLQHFNREIKIICKKTGIRGKVLCERTKGRKRISRLVPKYQLISSHTARRSAATNMYLAGILPFRIMLITGHKTEKSFFRYIRISRDENVKILARHKFFTGEKKK